MIQPTLKSEPPHSVSYLLGLFPLSYCNVTGGWLLKNWHVWEAFYNATERLRLAGKRRGAKCVYEFLRYETAVRDAEATFKINNNYVSGLARLYNDVSGTEFFKTRNMK